MLTVGVEEEFYIVDPSERRLAPEGLAGLPTLQARYPEIAGFDNEFQLPIVESRTSICDDLDTMRSELLSLRHALGDTAAEAGLSIISAGTMPLAEWRAVPVTPKPRYVEILDHYRDVVRRRNTCGCHVHVGIADRDLAAQVLARVRPWLPVLLALSVSSPFDEAADTGYESSRSLLWGGFPVAGMPAGFTSYADYTEKVETLIDAGAILDAGHIYWDARLAAKYETLEFRIADACTTVDEVILQVALCRAMVMTCVRATLDGDPVPSVRHEFYRAASWRAARSGLHGNLIDVVTQKQAPADAVVRAMVGNLRDALEETGDWDEVVDLLSRTQRRGTSSQRQRAVFSRSGALTDVVDHLVAETTG